MLDLVHAGVLVRFQPPTRLADDSRDAFLFDDEPTLFERTVNLSSLLFFKREHARV